jgi:hypothetical protein
VEYREAAGEWKVILFGVANCDAKGLKKTKELPKVGGKRRRKLVWQCPYYRKWFNMIRRCYDTNYLYRHTYQDVSVCDDWLTFSNFRSWMMGQDWENKALDKDLLGDGKLYSPNTCCFLPQSINNFLLTYSSDKYTGVTEYGKRFYARHGKVDIGSYHSFIEAKVAYDAYRKQRALVICQELPEHLRQRFLEKYVGD